MVVAMAPSPEADDARLLQEHEGAFERIVHELGHASRVLFITGAGLSADAGLPTYRGIGGLYTRGLTEDGIPIEEALSGETLVRRPELAWKYILQVEAASRAAKPSRGHEVIAALSGRGLEVWVLTQNVDGLHRAAGSHHVIDIHGDVHHILCTACSYHRSVDDYEGLPPVPRCPRCGAVLRPDVVLFGEMLPFAKLELLREQLGMGFDAIFSVGTSSVFPYIAQPVLAAERLGGFTVEINPERTPVTAFVSEKLPMRAALALGELWRRLEAAG